MKTLIDLFAGCGGLSLGLEKAGFTPIYVNELHPDAMQTYIANRPKLPVAKSSNQSNDITKITRSKNDLKALATRLTNSYGDIDLVAGGPPCQGFSGIGHRRSFEVTKKQMPNNHLYREMAKFIAEVGPKIFIFENVRGLLNSKWTPQGTKGEIWNDVLKTFHDIKVKKETKNFTYNIYWELLFAKDFGVPQNRPRIIMIGIRSDVNVLTAKDIQNIFQSQKFQTIAPNPIELLGDLIDPSWVSGGSTVIYPSAPKNKIQEMLRYNPISKNISKKGDPLTDHDYARHSPQVLKKFKYMLAHEGKITPSMQTKKFAQRLIPEYWGEKGPFITATSLPDDYVHFSQPRVLSVREWARLQTFPDWYQFHGKRTTGGRRRAGDPSLGIWTRDLPKYTQIGNAVPVNLAMDIGKIVLNILNN